MNKELLFCGAGGWAGDRRRWGWRGQTRGPLSAENTPLTTFHRSLTRESTLRMSACSAPPLISSADQGRCPHCFPPPSKQQPHTGPGIWALMENPAEAKSGKSVEFWLFRHKLEHLELWTRRRHQIRPAWTLCESLKVTPVDRQS